MSIIVARLVINLKIGKKQLLLLNQNNILKHKHRPCHLSFRISCNCAVNCLFLGLKITVTKVLWVHIPWLLQTEGGPHKMLVFQLNKPTGKSIVTAGGGSGASLG